MAHLSIQTMITDQRWRFVGPPLPVRHRPTVQRPIDQRRMWHLNITVSRRAGVSTVNRPPAAVTTAPSDLRVPTGLPRGDQRHGKNSFREPAGGREMRKRWVECADARHASTRRWMTA
jgi:hypothetical protein